MTETTRCLALLARWADHAERYWLDLGQGRGCYGTGYDNWGVQTNQKYIGALAVLATHDDAPMYAARERMRSRALAALRFSLDSHKTGPGACTDGRKWGHTWISALGIERMMHGVARLEPYFEDADRAALRRMLASEADWLAREHARGKHVGVSAGKWHRDGANAPESNIWNGALLWRAAVRDPGHPHAAEWREAAHRFLINGASVEADARDERVVAGKPVKDRYVGPNFFDNYALDHHGYLNVGYMAICVSNAAMLHFDLSLAGLERPATLDHHQADLWRVLRRMVFADGRLARIGGDSRVRYCYCQEYLLQSCCYAAAHLGDEDAMTLARGFLKIVEDEARYAGDGSFFGRRLAQMAANNPHYYPRLESDRACALSQFVAYAPLAVAPAPQAGDAERFEASAAGAWCEPEHGAVLHRSPKRFASFAWRAYGLGQGMCQPPDDGHLADWQQNLGGEAFFLGAKGTGESNRKLLEAHVHHFDGGFAAWGAIAEGMDLDVAEGWRGTDAGVRRLAFFALPDGRSVVGLEHLRAGDWRPWLLRLQGMHALLPNDCFNGFRRELVCANGSVVLDGPPEAEELRALGSRWACLDGKLGWLGLYGADELSIHRVPQRRGGKYGTLFVEHLGWPTRLGAQRCAPREVLLDAGWMVVASASAGEMRALAAANAKAQVDAGDVRAARVQGADGKTYVLAANFSETAQALPASCVPPGARDLLNKGGAPDAQIAPGGVAVLQIG